MNTYTRKQKEKLAAKIQNLKRKKDFVKIFEIIQEGKKTQSQGATENNGNLFMYFHNLNDETYLKIENYLKSVKKPRQESTISEGTSEKKEYIPYSQEEYPTQKNMGLKLKLSNKEKNILKRCTYDKKIKSENNGDDGIEYRDFNVSNYTDSDILSENGSEKNGSEKVKKTHITIDI